MMNNVLVYAIAGRYDIPKLQQLARHKFSVSTAYHCTDIEFSWATQAVFTTSSEHDTSLREDMISLYTKEFHILMSQPDIMAAVMDTKELSFALIKYMVQRCNEDTQGLERALDTKAVFQEDLSDARKEIVRIKREFSQSQNDHSKSIQELAKMKEHLPQTQMDPSKREQELSRIQMDLSHTQTQFADSKQQLAKTKKALSQSQNDFSRCKLERSQSNRQHQVSLDKLQKEGSELVRSRQELSMVRQQLGNFHTGLDNLIHNANQWTECRNCGKAFGSWLERSHSDDMLAVQLRCSSCRCRHDVGAGILKAS
jgi:myosin heavy subunit